MPIGTDYRQAIVLALEAQGADQLTIVRDGIRAVQAQMQVLNDMQREGMGPREYIKHLGTLANELRKLQALEADIATRRKADVQDQIADEAKLQAALGQMENRRRSESHQTEEQARRESEETARQQLEDEAKLQAALGAMEARQRKESHETAEQAKRDSAEAARQQLDDEAKLQAALGAMEARQRADSHETAEQAKRDAAEAWRARGEAHARLERQQASFLSDIDRQLGDAQRKRIDDLAKAERQTTKWADSMDKLKEKSKQAGNASKDVSYGLLHISHALQDAQYGFGAILNNIPLVVQALGGGPGLAGTIMIVGTAINTVMPYMTEFGKKLLILRDPIKDATSDLAGLVEQRDALAEKPFKVQADYESIRVLSTEIDKATKWLKEWEAIRLKQPKKTEDAKDVIAKALAEGGPGTQDRFMEFIIAASKQRGTYGVGSTIPGKIAEQEGLKQMAEASMKVQERIAGPFKDLLFLDPIYKTAEITRDMIQAEIDKLQNKMRDEAVENASAMIGLQYGPASQAALQDLMLDPKLAALRKEKGIPNTTALGIIMASPYNMEAKAADEKMSADRKQAREAKEKKDRNDAEIARLQRAGAEWDVNEAKRERREATTAHQKQVREAVQRVKPGMDEELELELFYGKKGRASELFRPVRQKMKDRGVAADIAGDAAKELLQEMVDTVANLKLEGKLPRAQIKQQQQEARLPGLQEKAAKQELGQQFQQNYPGIDDLMAKKAGEEIYNLAKQGADLNTAAETTFRRMMEGLIKLNANNEQLHGIFEGASQELANLNRRTDFQRNQMNRMSGRQQAGRQRGPTLQKFN